MVFHSIFRVNALLLMAAVTLVAFADVGSAEPGSNDLSAILMTVNGHPLRRSDLEIQMQINFGPKFNSLTADQKDALRINKLKKARAQVVDRILLVDAATKAGITASAAEVLTQLESVKKELPADMTMDAYLQGIGIPATTFRKHATDQVLINKLSLKKTEEIAKPTAEEIERHYRGNPEFFNYKQRARVSHILVTTVDAITDEQRAAKRAKAEVIRRQLLSQGADKFATMAHEVSNCPSKSQGGDLGIIEQGTMVKAIDTAIFAQKVGEIGRVVRSPKGYHIIKVNERIPAKKLSLQEARKDIENVLYFKARDQAMEAYLQTLRLKARVKSASPATPR